MREWYSKYSPIFYKWVEQHKIMLLLLCVLAILRGKVVDWLVEYICPITQYADGWWVLPTILAAVGILYIIQYKRIQAEREKWVSRYWTLILLFGVYMLFRFVSHYELIGIGTLPISYLDYAWVFVGIIEIVLYCNRRKKIKERETVECKAQPFITDAPSKEDEMGRGKYAEQLIEKVYATHQNADEASGAFAILLNEHYGAGKTTFMLQMQRLAEQMKMDVCWFKPWLYDDSKMLVVNFIRVIQEKIGDGDKPLQKMLSRYAQALSTNEKFEWLSAIVPEAESIETQFDEIKERLLKLKQPIIVLIDDVDRLQNDELLRMLQMVRNMGDFPHIFYIIAADKVALQNRLHEAGMTEPDEYLKKFFNLEISFPADDMFLTNAIRKGVEEIMVRYGLKAYVKGVLSFIAELRYHTAIFANIRDVKRYLNVLDFKLANLQENRMLGDVYMRDVAGVCMIQCIDSEFYQILRDHNEYILEYKDWHLKVKKDFQDVLADRSTKKMLFEAMSSVPIDGERPKNQIKEELAARVKSLEDLVEWSKPTKMEIIAELMEKLFPQSHASDSKVAVCHPTEYFKYFSTIYKGTEISNAEIIGILQKEKTLFRKEVERIIKQGKLSAFRHKLQWFMQTQGYNRVQAIEYIMEAFNLDWEATGDGAKSFKEISFLQFYIGSLFAVFRVRNMEEELSTYARAWKDVSKWLIESTNYEYRIWVLNAISKHVENPSSYIFKSHENVMQCVEVSEKQFVEKVWSKHKYDPQIYQWIPVYYGINPKIMNYVLEELIRMKNKSIFLYHLLKYENGDLKWNKEYIDTLWDTNLVFVHEDSQWRKILPEKWQEEFLHMNIKATLTHDDIKKSDFLRSALWYWKRVSKTNR